MPVERQEELRFDGGGFKGVGRAHIDDIGWVVLALGGFDVLEQLVFGVCLFVCTSIDIGQSNQKSTVKITEKSFIMFT